MSEYEREMLDALTAIANAQSDLIESLADQVSELNDRVEAQRELLETLGATSMSTVVDVGVANMITSALLAEVAQGDRERFDTILAKTVVLVESHVARLADKNSKPMLLGSLDSILEMAEEAFGRDVP